MPAPLPTQERLNIVVCGSGNGAQTAAGHLGAQGHDVWVYMSPAYAERAAALRAAIAANGGAILLHSHAPDGSPAATRAGPVAGVSTDAAALLPRADIVVLSVTGPAMDGLARELAPHLRPHQLLVWMQGLGAVNFEQLRRAVDAAGGRPLPMLAATRTLPWACRVAAPARVNVCGTKACVGLVLPPGTPALEAAMVCRLLHWLLPDTEFETNPSPIEASFLPFDVYGNAVLHPGIMYGTWAAWDGRPLADRPRFYTTASDAAVEAVEGLQAEAAAVVAALAAALGLAAPPAIPDVRSDLAAMYGPAIGDPRTLASLLRTNQAYAGVYHPMTRAAAGDGWVPDFGSRMLTEDVPCGLVPIRGAAEILGVPTPWTDRVIEWAQARMGRQYLVAGRLAGADVAATDAPQAHGATSPQQLIISLERGAACSGPAAGAGALRRQASTCAAELQAGARLHSAHSLPALGTC